MCKFRIYKLIDLVIERKKYRKKWPMEKGEGTHVEIVKFLV
jgi:hypothetical protein